MFPSQFKGFFFLPFKRHLQPGRVCPTAGTGEGPRGSGKRPPPKAEPPARARPAQGDAGNSLFFSSLASFASRRFWGKGRRAEGIRAGNKRARCEPGLFPGPALQSAGADSSSLGTSSPGTDPGLHPSFGVKIAPKCPETAAAFGGLIG